jgi:ribosome-binding factor A
MSKRTDQISGVMSETIAEIIYRDIDDPEISGIVTITGTKISPDLRTAKVFFSVLGTEKDWLSTEKALNRAAGFIQKILAKKIVLKLTPKLLFLPDHTVENAQKIEQLIDDTAVSNIESVK